MQNPKVSIIIVNYNTCGLLRNCLNSIFEKTLNIDFEVIVSDNGSKDGSIQMLKKEFPKVVFVENDENLGFGTANNRGLDKAQGECVLYLNSDTLLLNNAVKIFYDHWCSRGKNIGALGYTLVDSNGVLTESYGSFPCSIKLLKSMLHHLIAFYVKNIMKLFRLDIRKLRPIPVYEKK